MMILMMKYAILRPELIVQVTKVKINIAIHYSSKSN